MNLVEITCTNNNRKKEYSHGTTLYEIARDMDLQLGSPVLAALVNNELKELWYEVYNPKIVQFIDISHPDGMRTYQRSLAFLLQKAIRDVLSECRLKVEHSVSKGWYCEITNGKDYPEINEINAIERRMHELVKQDIPFVKKKLPTNEAIKVFEAEGYEQKALLQKTRSRFFTSVYYLGNTPDHFYGPLAPTTGCLKTFGLFSYYHGILLMFPRSDNYNRLEQIVVQNKMFEIFQEHKDWNTILGVGGIGSINHTIQTGNGLGLIQINEALHEKKYAHIADIIAAKHDKIKLVLISGPSSSGKTTTSKRLATQLKVVKVNPVVIELDNYFVDREHTPRDEHGEYDFEHLHALDLEFFGRQMFDLFDGKKIQLPKFNFSEGKRTLSDKFIKLGPNDVLIMEGIHALNPELIKGVPDDVIFRIYASALTSVAIDENNRIPTTDNRLIRRIVRDANMRGYTALDTIRRWRSVRRGEDRNIFPNQENADIMFNSSLLYELSVLRRYVEPLLRKVPPTEPEYAEALRLLKFISYFEPISVEDEKMIPPTSVIREFIGGSSFTY
ncbi:MAG: nucleoside kinase [Prevotellaceae bacterium]|jgi:uridine kinase|nr:nucleoside kinase [Prevotellaceae bacterium]